MRRNLTLEPTFLLIVALILAACDIIKIRCVWFSANDTPTTTFTFIFKALVSGSVFLI